LSAKSVIPRFAADVAPEGNVFQLRVPASVTPVKEKALAQKKAKR
jgi:hypothetical protein